MSIWQSKKENGEDVDESELYTQLSLVNKTAVNKIEEFEDFIKNGGFPGALYYDEFEDKITYISSVVQQIFEKDIKTNNKIKDVALFEVIEKFIINNFGSVISVSSIYEYLVKKEKLKVDRRTLKRYIDILEKAKIIYSCDLFDIKSKMVLKGEKKYYLADFSIYYTLCEISFNALILLLMSSNQFLYALFSLLCLYQHIIILIMIIT